ncbi:MAG: endonuclease/exonuclease/phosphatase family protein [Pirellulaceae bacterium]
MPKNPLSWLSLPALLTIMAYIGCQPKDIQRIQQEITRQAWQQMQQQAQNGLADPRLNNTFGNGSNTGGVAPIYPPTSQTNPQAGYYTNAPYSTAPTIPNSYNPGYQPSYVPAGYAPAPTSGWDQPVGNFSGYQTPGNQNTTSAMRPIVREVPFDDRSLIIGTFNIQTFGRAKLSNPSVMQVIVEMIRRFDLIAIQELRSTEQIIIPKLVEMLNANGLKFGYYVGERQGYTDSKEQYVYIFDTTKLQLLSEPFIAPTQTPMHRAPLVAHFQATQVPDGQAFTFALLNVHTDPDEVTQKSSKRNELLTLKQAIDNSKAAISNEDDFIILGDFNAPTDYMSKFFPWFASPIYVVKDDWVTNVRENKNYDNIVFDARYTTEYDGRCGVFNFKREYQLLEQDALQVSDHFPIWATFSIFEGGNPSLVARQQPFNQPR